MFNADEGKPARGGSIVPTRLAMASAGLVVVLLLAWRYAFIAVSAEVRCSPEELAPGGDAVELRVIPLNRLGFRVPFQQARLRVEVLEGAELVDIRIPADSTVALITSHDRPGTVALRIRSSAFAYPMYCSIPIRLPLAGGSSALDEYPDGLQTCITVPGSDPYRTTPIPQHRCTDHA